MRSDSASGFCEFTGNASRVRDQRCAKRPDDFDLLDVRGPHEVQIASTAGRDANRAKVWLDPVPIQESGGFPPAELARILMTVREHETVLQRGWDDYFAE
jgi:hypothetical protein